MDVPDLEVAWLAQIVEQSDEQAAGRTVMRLGTGGDVTWWHCLRRFDKKMRQRAPFLMRSTVESGLTDERD